MKVITSKQLEEWLLSNPADEVVGYSKSATTCPVANCLRERYGQSSGYTVSSQAIYQADERVQSLGRTSRIGRFVHAADRRGGDITAAEALEIWRAK